MPLVFAAMIAAASPAGWTFCVAEAGQDVYITGVFATSRRRESLEAAFAQALRARGVVGAVAQCPAPQDDRTEVFNAQFTATEFQRKLGRTLHAFAGALR